MLHANETVGPYTVLRLLETHGRTSLWLAGRRGPPETLNVALKCFENPDVDVSLIQQEADIWVGVTGHPNIVSFIETVPHNDKQLIASEYISGGSLAQFLSERRGTALPYQLLESVMLGILTGLEHLHAKGVIHRDVKPSSVYLRGDTSCLGGFGSARFIKASKERYAIAGTPIYMAPEAWAGTVTQQGDIWSAAAVLYELLTGRAPFSGTTFHELIEAISNVDPEPLPTAVPSQLKQVVARGLQKNETLRYGTAAEMGAALQEAFASSAAP
jgi:serine/threonine-protein kinase